MTKRDARYFKVIIGSEVLFSLGDECGELGEYVASLVAASQDGLFGQHPGLHLVRDVRDITELNIGQVTQHNDERGYLRGITAELEKRAQLAQEMYRDLSERLSKVAKRGKETQPRIEGKIDETWQFGISESGYNEDITSLRDPLEFTLYRKTKLTNEGKNDDDISQIITLFIHEDGVSYMGPDGLIDLTSAEVEGFKSDIDSLVG